MRLLLALFLIVLTACSTVSAPARSPAPPARKEIVFYVDKRFADGDKAAIYQAVYEWKRAMVAVADIKVHEDPRKDARILVTAGRWAPEEDGTILGVTSDLKGRMIRLDVVNINDFNLDMRQVVLHEIGHAFGVDHQIIGLMYPSVNGIFSMACIDVITATVVERENDYPEGSVVPSCGQ